MAHYYISILIPVYYDLEKHELPRFFSKNTKRHFLAQRTQWQHKGHKGETLTRLYIQNKKKSRRIALSKSRLCVLCAAIVSFVLIFSL